MARRNRRAAGEHRQLSSGTVRRIETQPDGDWVVATWAGRDGAGEYTCPICHAAVAGRASHLVVWPHDADVGQRRHVHATCWRRRARMSEPVRW